MLCEVHLQNPEVSRHELVCLTTPVSSSPSMPARRTGTTLGNPVAPTLTPPLSSSHRVSAGRRREHVADQLRRRRRQQQLTKEHRRMRYT